MTWHKKITSLLDGTALGILPERLDWTGYISLYKLFMQAPPHEQNNITEAMQEIIEESRESKEDKQWFLAADIIHLGYSLNIEQLVDAVKKIDPEKAPTSESKYAVEYACQVFLATSSTNQ